MADTLMLWPDITEDIPNAIKRRYSEIVEVRNLYRKTGKAGRLFRKILSQQHMSTARYFDNWIDTVHQFGTVIIHANVINQSVPDTLRKMGYKGRIIYWYWNPVCNCVSPDRINRDCCELWSFSADDCKEHHMSYNSTYYFEEPTAYALTGKKTGENDSRIETQEEIDMDIFFVGADKGRYGKLMELKEVAEKAGLKTDFRIIRDASSNVSGEYSSRLDYEEVVRLTKKSRAILEILQEGQTGMSLRPMEAIFFGKKLITDNMAIQTEKFYDNRVVLVLDGRETEKDFSHYLYHFVRENDGKVSHEYIDYYDFKNWLKRFG